MCCRARFSHTAGFQCGMPRTVHVNSAILVADMATHDVENSESAAVWEARWKSVLWFYFMPEPKAWASLSDVPSGFAQVICGS